MSKGSFDLARENKIFTNPILKFLNGIKRELFVLFLTFVFVFTAKFTMILIWGWFGPSLAYPALSFSPAGQNLRARGQDTDGDGLPDVIEEAPEGVVIVNQNNQVVGWGTGTDPYNPDTDGDFFPDGLENSIGSDPNAWIYPGIIWIFWTFLLLLLIYFVFFRKVDRTKQYIRNEEKISGSTVKSNLKYAYSMPTIASTQKIRSARDIHRFRTSLASDLFDIDDNTAMGFALLKKRTSRIRATGSFFITLVLVLWAFMDSMDMIVDDKYDSYEIDRIIGAWIKLVFAVIALIFFFYFFDQYKKSDRRSKQLLAD